MRTVVRPSRLDRERAAPAVDLPVPGQVELVPLALRQRLQAAGADEQRPVADRVAVADQDRGARRAGCPTAACIAIGVPLDGNSPEPRSPTRKPTPNAAATTPAASRNAAPRRRRGSRDVSAPRRPRAPRRAAARARAAARPRSAGRARAGAARAPPACPSSPTRSMKSGSAHPSSSSSSSARRRSPLRVRVFTVPSGIAEEVRDLALRQAAPVGELEHARSVSGRSSIARCTR